MLVGAANVGPWEILVLLFFFFGLSVPAFVVGRRRGVKGAGVAFVPFVGPWIVILWSIERSGWLVLLTFIPLVGLVFAIWAAFTIPDEHGRTKWWALPFLIPGVNFAGFWVYAFTLKPAEPTAYAVAS